MGGWGVKWVQKMHRCFFLKIGSIGVGAGFFCFRSFSSVGLLNNKNISVTYLHCFCARVLFGVTLLHR